MRGNSRLIFMQRVVAPIVFYNAEDSRFGTDVIQNEENILIKVKLENSVWSG